MIKQLSVLEISMIDMVRAAIERFNVQYPDRTAKFLYAPEPLLHLIAQAVEASAIYLCTPPEKADAVNVLGVQLAYNSQNTIMVSDLTAKEINGALILNGWDTEGRTKQ